MEKQKEDIRILKSLVRDLAEKVKIIEKDVNELRRMVNIK